METPEEFARELLVCKTQEGWWRRIEARDNAVRLALLDELEARSAGLIPYPMREQVAKLRLKYTPPRGKL